MELRFQRQKHTDFFFKLHELKERIEVFNTIFGSKKPKFINLEYQRKVMNNLKILMFVYRNNKRN